MKMQTPVPTVLSALLFAAAAGCSGTDEPGMPSGGAGGSASGSAGLAVGGSNAGSTFAGTAGAAVAGSGSAAAGAPTAGAGGNAAGAIAAGGAAPSAGAPGGAGQPPTAGAGGSTSGVAGAAGAAGGTQAGAGAAGAAGAATGGTVPLEPALLSKCTGSNPIVCSFPVANGNHAVTVELGDSSAASTSRVQSELYRISVPPTQLAAAATAQFSFGVNVRAEKHDGYSAPGGVLNLVIDGAAPKLRGVGIAPAPAITTIFVAGDSTVCDWDPAATNVSSADQRGWAQALTQYFLPSVAVANYADSGETAGGFYGKFWPGSSPIKASDYVFIQFGHNDQKNAADVSSYKTNLMRYVNDARAKNATPVLFTPVGRKGATIASPGFAGLDQQVRELAAAENVALVDLTTLSINYFRSQSNVNQFFAGNGSDGTHLSEVGAVAVSKLVADAIKASALPLKAALR